MSFLCIVVMAVCLPTLVRAASERSGAEPGRYSYNIRWKSMTAGKATVTILATNGHDLVTTSASTENLARHLLTARYEGMARVTPDMNASAVMEDRTIRNRRVVTYTEFMPDGTIDITQGKVRPRRYVRTSQLSIEEQTGAIDAFTAVLRMRAVPWERGRTFECVLLLGDELYNLKLTCRGATRVRIDGVRHPVWQLRPEMSLFVAPGSATTDDLEDREDTMRAVENASFYISRDEQQRIVSIETRTALGRFSVELSDYTSLQP